MTLTENREPHDTARRPTRRPHLALLTSLGALVLAGCAGPALPPTPNLYVQGDAAALVDMPPDRQTVDIELLYATDRMPAEHAKTPAQRYDGRRSPSLALGRATVRLGRELSWDTVRDESLDPRGRRIPVELTAVEELVRFLDRLRPEPGSSDDPDILLLGP